MLAASREYGSRILIYSLYSIFPYYLLSTNKLLPLLRAWGVHFERKVLRITEILGTLSNGKLVLA